MASSNLALRNSAIFSNKQSYERYKPPTLHHLARLHRHLPHVQCPRPWIQQQGSESRRPRHLLWRHGQQPGHLPRDFRRPLHYLQRPQATHTPWPSSTRLRSGRADLKLLCTQDKELSISAGYPCSCTRKNISVPCACKKKNALIMIAIN